MAYTENSGEGGLLSNSQSTYTTPNSLAAGDITESNKAIQCFDRSFAEDPHFYGYPTAWKLQMSNGADQYVDRGSYSDDFFA